MLDFIRNSLFATRTIFTLDRSYNGKKYNESKIRFEMIRNVHSIEKGMCISNMRLGYGKKKIEYLIGLVEEYISSGFDTEATELKMVCASLRKYGDLHEAMGYNDEFIDMVKKYSVHLEEIIGENCNKYAGYITITNDWKHDSSMLEEIINRRHSIREFTGENVSDEDILRAVEMANKCPSACNRQSTRIYIVDKEKAISLKGWLSGIGGFVDDISKFLIITGKASAFNNGETFQYIVSAGILTGYLTLCLNELGIGNCVIQRPLLSAPTWQRFARENRIPGDEQLVCMVALGVPKKECSVPISYRLPAKELVRKL